MRNCDAIAYLAFAFSNAPGAVLRRTETHSIASVASIASIARFDRVLSLQMTLNLLAHYEL